MISDTR